LPWKERSVVREPARGAADRREGVVVRAAAKVNLFLRVTGARPDGFHDIETLIVPLSLADRIGIRAGRSETDEHLSLEVEGDPGLTSEVPTGEENLILRAARALRDATGVRGFAEFSLSKAIPTGAGLGGGSADAAAALRALNLAWGCGLDESRLSELAAGVGSDVPALMAGGPIVARGRGERVEAVRIPGLSWALATLPFGVSTADAYRWWDEDGAGSGPDPAGLVAALSRLADEGAPDETLRDLVYNDLEAPVVRRRPLIAEVKDLLLSAGSLAVVMCGSGSSVAAILPGDRPELDATHREEIERLCGRTIIHAVSEAS